MSSFQEASYMSLRTGNNVVDTSALRCVGCVHVLIGLATICIGIMSSNLYVYLGWMCVGIWTGISFLICGIISFLTGKSGNTLTVLLMACTHVITLNFACTGAVITFSSLFPGHNFYAQGGDSGGIAHNPTTGTILGIVHLVVSFIEIAVCVTGVRITWRILTSFINAESYRERTQSYDEPYLSSGTYPAPSPLETRRRISENPTPPPTYDVATHSLSTSPKTVNGGGSHRARYGSMSDSQSDLGAVSGSVT